MSLTLFQTDLKHTLLDNHQIGQLASHFGCQHFQLCVKTTIDVIFVRLGDLYMTACQNKHIIIY